MISPQLGAELAEPVAELYRDAELRLLTRITSELAQGIDLPNWEVQQLARAQQLTQWATAELTRTNAAAGKAIQAQLSKAYDLGGASAIADIRDTIPPVAATPQAKTRALTAIVGDLLQVLADGQTTMLRNASDIYARIVGEATASLRSGATDRRTATQEAIDRFLAAGLPSIPTGRGTMDIATYTTMAIRTAGMRSALQGTIDTAATLGLHLVLIHPGPRACPICDEWAGRVLTTSGVAGTYTVRNEVTGQPMQIEVFATLDEARSQGWGHPNCRCGLQVIIPGATSIEVSRPPFLAQEYAAQQKQRGIERRIRAAKVKQATALTDEAKVRARGDVRRGQAAMRQHLAEHDYLKRQSEREQIGGIYGKPSG